MESEDLQISLSSTLAALKAQRLFEEGKYYFYENDAANFEKARDCFEQITRMNDASLRGVAFYYLSRFYKEKLNLPSNHKNVTKNLEMAMSCGYADAYYSAGVEKCLAEDDAQNIVKGITLLKEAASKGHVGAKLLLMFHTFCEIDWENVESVWQTGASFVEKLALKNNVICQFLLALSYEEKNKKIDARKWFKAAAQSGWALGQYFFATFIGSDDRAQAGLYLLRAANNGFFPARVLLEAEIAKSLKTRIDQIKEGLESASGEQADLLRDLRDLGDPVSYFSSMVETVTPEELGCLGLSAENLAGFEGLDIKKMMSCILCLDKKQKLKQLLDDKKNEVYTYLGFSCYNGYGTQKDIPKAFAYFKKAADRNFSLAQFNLAVCYHNGFGVNKDIKEAINWYGKAAAKQCAPAQWNLAAIYEFGEGVPQDLVRALQLYTDAVSNGHEKAVLRRAHLLSR